MAVTEKWTARRGATQQRDSAGKLSWEAAIVFQVTEATSEREAVAQCPFAMGSDHDVYGSELRVNRIAPQRSGANQFYEVEFGFSSAAPGAGGSVNTKAKVAWGDDVVIEQVDRDFDGRPLFNSTGDPSATPLTNEFVDLVLSYTRWEPSFDVRKAVRYRNAINEDKIKISFGAGPFNGSGNGFGNDDPLGIFEGELKCTAFRPVGEYEEDQSLVQIYYEFRIRERIKVTDTTWASGWDWRFCDKGSQGLYVNTNGGLTRGVFWDARRQPPTELVKLDGYGKPLDSAITVQGHTPFAASTPPAGADLDERYKSSDPAAVFLIYKKCKRTSFKGLLPIFK